LGATGLVGSAIAARLAADGHHIVAVSRCGSRQGLAPVHHVILDIARVCAVETWLPLLRDIDAVVNCAGTLQAGPGESTRGVHVTGIASLFAACEASGVRRVVHLSAVGVEREASAFSATKHEGEAVLMSRDLDWVILRPSVVIGRAAYGGSALLRGLASLPLLPLVPEAGPLQLVHLDDLVETVARCLAPQAPRRVILEVVGPRQWTFADAIGLIRRWLRWPPASTFPLPAWAATLLYRMGDAVSLLGWRPPLRSTARQEIAYGAVGDAGEWRKHTGIVPMDVEAALAREPASVQERWFARLYLLKPLIFGVFALFWLATGLISLGPGWEHGIGLVREGGVAEPWASLSVVAGALADIIIGLAILYRPTARYGLWAALIISLAYAIIGTILVPRLWIDPLGPMLKIWPILVLNMVALAIREDR
jgi:uncharacterized protein YbjT (DUF2867 family)